MSIKNPLIQFTILFSISIINHFWIFSHEQMYDSLIFWSVKNLPHVNSLNYFIHIFTNFTGHAGQYRPLGFFGYFYILGNLFNSNFLYYSLVSIIIFTMTAYLIKKWVENNFFNIKLAWFASILYIFAPATVFVVFDVSCGGKYLLTSLILIYQFNYIDQKVIDRVSFKNGIILFILNLTAFLLHEGSVVFPLAMLVYFAYKKIRVSSYFLFSFYPALAFFYLRFVANKAPKSGIMHIGLSKLWVNFSEIQGMLWNPIFNLFNCGFLGTFLALIIAMTIFIHKQKKDLLFILIMNLILIMPFVFLDSHVKGNIVLKGTGWALIPTVMFFANFINYLESFNKTKLINSIMVLLLIVVNLFFYSTRKQMEPFLTEFEITQMAYLDRIKSKIASSSEEYVRITGRYPNSKHNQDINQAIAIYQAESIPGMLLKYFPDRKFILTHSARFNDAGEEMETLVQNGYYLYIQERNLGKAFVKDRFNYQSEMNLDVKNIIEISDFPAIDKLTFF